MGHSTQETVSKRCSGSEWRGRRCFSPLNWKALCQDPNSGIGKLFRCQLLIYGLSAPARCLVLELPRPLFAGVYSLCRHATSPHLTALQLQPPLWHPFRNFIINHNINSQLTSMCFVLRKNFKTPSPADNAETITQKWYVEAATKIYFKLALSWVLLYATAILQVENRLPISELTDIGRRQQDGEGLC